MRILRPLLLALPCWAALGAAEVPAHPPTAARTPAPDPHLLDAVPLTNHQVLYGLVQPGSTDDSLVLNTGSGTLRLPMTEVDRAHIDYGLTTRKARLATYGVADLMDFARWCERNHYPSEERQALDRAAGLPDTTPEVAGQLGLVIDRSSDASDAAAKRLALTQYQKYQAGGGTDPQILHRLAYLQQALDAYAHQLTAQGLPVSDAGSLAADATHAAPISNGLEAHGWQAEELQWSLPVTVQTATDTDPDSGAPISVLSVVSPGKASAPATPGHKVPDKCAIKRTIDLILVDKFVVSFKVRNKGEQPVQLAFAVKTSDQWLFYESAPIQVLASDAFKTVQVDLKGKTFKSETTHWFPTGPVKDLDQIKELQLLIYNRGAAVDLQIADMHLVKDAEM